jgi:hypothetical protein
MIKKISKKREKVEDIKEIKDIKINYSFIIYSIQKVKGVYNYDSCYSCDWTSFFNKYPNDAKFKVKWFLGSRNKLNHSGDNMGLLFIDFSSQINQQDTKGNNNVHNMGLVKVNNRTIASNTYYWITNHNENEIITISKPTTSLIRVYFRTCDNLYYFNGLNDGTNYNYSQDLPDFYIKIEFEPIL